MLGADGLFEGLSEGNMWIDHTTSSYEQTIELTGEATKRGFRPIECPITGGKALFTLNDSVKPCSHQVLSVGDIAKNGYSTHFVAIEQFNELPRCIIRLNLLDARFLERKNFGINLLLKSLRTIHTEQKLKWKRKYSFCLLFVLWSFSFYLSVKRP